MRIEMLSRKSPLKSKIEDAYALNREKQIYGVFDGVTPLYDVKDQEGDNGARKASQLFKAHFEHAAVSPDLSSELAAANEKLRQLMIESGVDLTQKHLLWATCAAVVHVGEMKLSFAQLGDCMIIAKDLQGKIQVLTRNQVEGVASRAVAKRKADRSQGMDVPEETYFEDVYQREVYHRWMANTPEGYGVANGMEQMKDYIQCGEVSVRGLSSVLLLTDGLFHLDDHYKRILLHVEEQGLEPYAESLAKLETVRGRRVDDKTGIWIQFKDGSKTI